MDSFVLTCLKMHYCRTCDEIENLSITKIMNYRNKIVAKRVVI